MRSNITNHLGNSDDIHLASGMGNDIKTRSYPLLKLEGRPVLNAQAIQRCQRPPGTRLMAVTANYPSISNIKHGFDYQRMNASQKIIPSLQALSEQETPERPLYRDAEYSQLLSNLKNAVNTIIYGPHGCGKTTLLKRATHQINSSKVRAVYIDCTLYETANAVLREILFDRPVSSRNNYDLLKRLIERARNTGFVVCLDHVQRLKQKKIIGQLVQVGICVAMACNSYECFSALDLSARTGIGSIIELKPYVFEEAFGIVRKKAIEYVLSDVWSDETVMRIVETAKGDVALAWSIFRIAALRAQNRKKKSIEEIDLGYILMEHDRPEGLNSDEKLILQILQEQKSLPARKLHEFYLEKSRHPKSERTLRNYVENLCSKGLVKALGEKRGRTYEITEAEQNLG
jgi:Cdc6-like AAA superfamily ATPase